MIPDFVHAIRAREPQRASLGQAVEQYLAAGGSIATVPYLATREFIRTAELNNSALRVQGIAADSRSKKRGRPSPPPKSVGILVVLNTMRNPIANHRVD